MLPLWLAMSASLALHIAVLLAPGWSLPLVGEHDPVRLDATLAAPPTTVPAAPVASDPARHPRPKLPAPKPVPGLPAATVAKEAPAVTEEAPSAAAAAPEHAAVAAPEAPPAAAPPAPIFAGQWPRQGRIVFQVMRGEDGFIVGQSEQRWSHDGERYTLRAVSETTGLAALFRPAKVMQESRGIFDASGLRPLEFETQREGKRKEGMRFDVETGRIQYANGASDSLVAGTQDLLALFHQLGAIDFTVPNFIVPVATARKVAHYAVTVEAPEELETPLGARTAWHLRVAGVVREDATEVWLDAQTRLPLKIRYRDRKGEIFDQIATTIELEQKE